jgi:hypothetical protein
VRGSRSRSIARAVAAVALLGVLVLLFRAPLLRASVAALLDVATGYRVAFGALDVDAAHLVARDVSVSLRGEPVLDIARLAIDFHARDLFPGGARRYGLIRIDVERPQVTLVRHADGALNVMLPGGAPGRQRAGPAAAGGPPWNLRVTIENGGVALLDDNRNLAIARNLSVEGVSGTLDLRGRRALRYTAMGDVAGDPAQRIAFGGRVDDDGYALHRVRARTIAIAPLVDYVINSDTAAFTRGYARKLDVSAYAFPGPAGSTAAYHLAGSGVLDGAAMRIPGLLPLATALGGRIDLFDDGVAAPRLRARIGGLAVKLAGGIYDWRAPQFRLGLAAPHSALAALRKLFKFSQRVPIAGTADLATLLEGSVGMPLVATQFASPALVYAHFPIDDASGRAVYYSSAIDVVGLRGRYGGLDVGVEGAIDLGAVTRSQIVARVRGPAARIPYVAQLAPATQLDLVTLLAGVGLAFDARGVAEGTGPDTSLAGLFHVDPLGDGTFGPFAIRRRDGSSIAGAFFLNRSESESGFWLQSDGFAVADLPSTAHLPGIALAAPDFHGRLDGSVAGDGVPSAFRIAGHLHARDLRVGTVRIDDVVGDLAGALTNVRLGRVIAHGPWGTFTSGRGDYVRGRLILDGDYDGNFTQLATLTGDLGASGAVRGPIALTIDPRGTLVQARGDRTPGARVRGVPLEGLDGTLAVTGSHLRVYAATAALAGGTLAAAGTLDGPGHLGVSVSGVRPERLAGLVPLDPGGRIAAIGTVGYAAKVARFDGGLTIGAGAHFDRLPLAANGDVALSRSNLDVRKVDAVLGAGVGSLGGDVSGLGTREARYDVGVHLTAARLAPFARSVLPKRHDIVGTLVGDVRITGSGTRPALEGTLELPEGSVNGLAFRDARASLDARGTDIVARRGTVTVGSTQVDFGARFGGDDAAIRLNAPHADLSDFNDYFDAGDTLGGRGRIAGRFRKLGRTVRTNADIAIASLHYRRFDLGDARAKWNSRGAKVSGGVGFGGTSGRLDVAGTLLLASRAPLAKLLERSRFDGNATLRGLDVGVWLPVLGYQLPVSGRIDADATIAGALRDPDVRTRATLVGGSIGKFPVDRFVFAATSTLSRTTVTQAELVLPFLSVAATGNFGLGERDRVALAVHAKSPDIGTFANRLLGTALPLSGTGEVDLKVDGTRANPRVAGGFDIEQASLRGVAVPRALGEISVRGRDVVLSDVEVGFATGTLYFAGSVPLQIAPFAVGPRQAPVTLELAAKGIDLADFAPLLPTGSVLKGRVDGRVAVGGTAGDPRLRGNLALSDAAIQTPYETVPLTNIGADLSFSGNDANLDRLHAEAGGGAIDASGSASFPNLVRAGADAAYHFAARAKKLRLSLPAYGSGQVDGALTLTHAAGTRARIGGALALNDATIPFSALLLAGGGASSGFDTAAAAPAPNAASALAFDLDVTADRNVRVRSANVDIGGRGTLHIGGTYGAPALAGGFTSTGGTLAYFNTVFRLVDGAVTFEPDLGVIPTLDARAVTHVINSDPNTVRNVAGTADVTLDVTGPVTNLSIALSSDPAYDRQQILGLLLNAPGLGATNLFGATGQTPTLFGSTATNNLTPGVVGVRNSNGQFSVAQEAFGIANAQFTRTLLAPIESTFASAVGLSSFNVNVDYTGSVGLSARKVLGPKVNALYGTTFGYPYRQTFGFEFKPNADTAAQVTAFETLGATGLSSLTPTAFITSTSRLQAAEPTGGTAGFSISLQRLFP